jgi:hypothetical protein
MKRHLASTFAVVATLAVAAPAWASELPKITPRTDKPTRRVIVAETPSSIGTPSAPGGTHRMILIDDVDKEAQRKAAQPQGAEPNVVRRIELAPLRRADLGFVGRYAVTASGQCTVLADTMTGETWLLCPAANGNPAHAAWLPIQRIDSREEALEWVSRQQRLKETPGARTKDPPVGAPPRTPSASANDR